MRPFSEIKVGQVYANPALYTGGGKFDVEYHVVDVNESDKLIKVQPVGCKYANAIRPPFWKKHTNRMFSPSWQVADFSNLI